MDISRIMLSSIGTAGRAPQPVAVAGDPEALATAVASVSQQATSASMNDAELDKLLQQEIVIEIVKTGYAGENPAIYEMSAEELALRTVNDRFQQGLRDGKQGEALMGVLDNAAGDIRRAYGNTSDILRSLGQLGPEQGSFLARSEERVERMMGSMMELGHRSAFEESDKRQFTFTLQTKDGDEVTISFSSLQGYDEEAGTTRDRFQVEYEVEGQLSDGEHQALTALFDDVGNLADAFFAGSSSDNYGALFFDNSLNSQLDLSMLADFDSEYLAGFDIEMSTPAVFNNSLEIHFDFDEKGEEQRLAVDWQTGVFRHTEFDLTTSTVGGADQRQLDEYMRMLDKSFEDSVLGDEASFGLEARYQDDLTFGATSLAMYKSAFGDMMSLAERHTSAVDKAGEAFDNPRQLVASMTEQLITADPRYQGLSTAKDGQFAQGLSSLADFEGNLSFNTYQHFDTYNLAMSQQTDQTAAKGYQGVSQQKDFRSSSGDYREAGSYQKEIVESYEIKAGLDWEGALALDQRRESSVEVHEQEFFQPEKFGITQYDLDNVRQAVSEQSSLRIVEGIWSEATERRETDSSLRIRWDNGESRVEQRHNTKLQQTLKIIGDLDRLSKDPEFAEGYRDKLEKLNGFMATV